MAATETGPGLVIYTDGCFEPKSRDGGWAFVVQHQGATIASDFGGIRQTSNNSTELIALLRALQWLDENSPGEAVTIWSDSVYAVRGCAEFLPIWRNNGWRKIETNSRLRKRKIADIEPWKMIDAYLRQGPPVSISWCKGHSGIPGNEDADDLAERGRLEIAANRSS